MLDFCDAEIIEAVRWLYYHLRDLGVAFRFGESVTAVERREKDTVTHLESGKRIAADVVLYSAGRQGAIDPPTSAWTPWGSRPTGAGASLSTICSCRRTGQEPPACTRSVT